MIAVVHPHGNPVVRNVLRAFHDEALLHRYYTSIGFPADANWLAWLPARLRQEVQRRTYALPGSYLHTTPWREAVRHLASRLPALRHLEQHETGWASVDQVYRAVGLDAAAQLRDNDSINAVYAFEDGASEVFGLARERDWERIYDLPIAYWRSARKLFQEEAEREPQWASTLSGLADSQPKRDRKDHELRSATRITVASSFTARSLQDFPEPLAAPVAVIPYGAPTVVPLTDLHNRLQNRTARAPLRVLFVGGLSQRKGLSYLFRAVRGVDAPVCLTIVGRPPAQTCAILDQELARHTYIPSLSHPRVLELMDEHDVLVLPSLFEGFGLVMLEAMARGLPVIATSHTAAPDLYTDGRDGFIVPIRDADAIATCLQKLAHDPAQREAFALAAHANAALRRWETYRQRLVQFCTAPAAKGILA